MKRLRKNAIRRSRIHTWIASTILACFLMQSSVIPAYAGTWNPTLLANTEAFQIIEDSNSTADIKLRFGDTVAEEIYWNRTNSRFQLTDDVHVEGNITTSGSLTVDGAAMFKSTIENGLVGWWAMDKMYSADDVEDLSVNDNSGALIGGPTLVAGRFGKAMNFDGTDDYIALSPTPATADAWSVSGWIKVTTFSSTKGWVYVGGDAVTKDQRVDVHSSGTMRAVSYYAGGADAVTTLGTLSTGQWYHVAVVRDPSALKLSIYIDGQFNNSVNLSSVTAAYGAGSQLREIGRLGIANYNSAQKSDDIRIYNRSLSAREIADLYRINPLGDGGTMQTSLRIESGASLNVSGTASGRMLHAQDLLTTSGAVIAYSDSKFKADLTINSDAGAADTVLTFGSDSVNETAKFLNNEDRFEFSDDLRTTGNLFSSGTLIVDGAAVLKSTIKLNGVTYTFPTSDGTASGKVLKTNSAGQLAWSADATGSAGIDYATIAGSFVKIAGDTMTGALIIANGKTLNVSGSILTNTDLTINSDNGAADAVLTFGSDSTAETLKFLNNEDRFEFSDDLNVTGGLYSSGALIVTSDSKFKADLTINSDNGAANAVLTFGNNTLAETLSFLVAESRFEFSDDLRVGSNLSVSGTLVLDSAARFKSSLRVTGVISGAYLYGSQGISTSGTLMISTPKIDNTGTWGSGALIVQQRVETATGAYMYSSGAAVLALDNYERTSRNPHLMFGQQGTFDTNVYRSSGSTLRTDDSLVIDGKLGLGTGDTRIETKAEVAGTLSGAGLFGYNINNSQTAATGSVLVSNSTNASEWKAPTTHMIWSIVGGLNVTATGGAVVTMPYGMLISTGSLRANVSPTGAAVQVDILKNGSSIFSTKPSIAVDTKTSDKTGTIGTTTLKEGDLIWVSITQVGSTIAGSGLTITLKGTRKY